MTLVIDGNYTGALFVATGTGLQAQTSTTSAAREIVAGAGISVTDGDGVTTDPVVTNTGVTAFNTRTGDVTLTSTDIDTALGYTPGDVTTTGSQVLTNKVLSGAVLNDGYTEEVYAVVDGVSVALSPNNGSIQTWSLGASRTPTAGTWGAGQSMTLMIDDGAGFTINWTSGTFGTGGVTWVNALAPTLATSGFTVIELWKVGAKVYGSFIGSVA